MTQSKFREQAEVAFTNAQSQFFARTGTAEELDHVAQARDAKTPRLREARLAHERQRLDQTQKPDTPLTMSAAIPNKSNWSHQELQRAIEAAGVALSSWNVDTDDLIEFPKDGERPTSRH